MRSGRTRLLVAVGVLGISALALWSVRSEVATLLRDFAASLEQLGAWAPLAFVGAYVLAVVAFVPALPLTLAGGAIFGPLVGVAYVFVAASLGACAAFLIARYVARGAIEQRISGNPRFAAIDRAIAERGLRIALLLRLSPVFPFSLLNYALGLTRVRFADYAVACVGMLPATAAYVYLGSLIGDLAGLGGDAHPSAASPWLRRGLSTLGLAATLAVVVVIARTARRALAELTESGGSSGPV